MTVHLDPQHATSANNTAGSSDASTRPVREEMLRLERDFLSIVIDHMDTLLVVLDQHGRIIRFNRACERLFGYSTDEIRAKLTTGALPLPQEISAIKGLLTQITSNKVPTQYESEWVSSNGNLHTIAWTISFLHRGNGALEYIFASGTDITKRKQVEKMLERERSLLQGLINSIPDLVFYKDCGGAYLGCNTAFENFRGCTAGELVGKNDASLYSPDLASQFYRTDQQVLQQAASVIYENWAATPGDGSILIETRKTPYYGPSGEILGVIGIGRDITRHRLVENELRAAKLEIEQILSSLSSILIALTADLRILRWNPMAQHTFGPNAQAVHQQPLEQLGLAWEWSSMAAAIQQCRTKRRPISPPPVRFKRQDGSEGILGATISPVFDQQEQLCGFILLASDITERKISENRRMQAQKLESIGQLAAGIAHEINTPIQYIGNNTAFLQDSFRSLLKLLQVYDDLGVVVKHGGCSQEMLQQVENLRKACEIDYLMEEVPTAIEQTMDGIRRVSEIVDAMKEFSHPGVKEKTLLDINQAIESTLRVTRNEWKYTTLLETDLQPGLPKVLCRPGEINQVLLNILVNAAQAIRSAIASQQIEQGKISVQTRAVDGWVEIWISDNGPGIPEEIHNRVFEPFFTTKQVGEGTGQGLSIAYDVIERKHGGELSFESQPGQGTTFKIRLPIQPADEQPSSGNWLG